MGVDKRVAGIADFRFGDISVLPDILFARI